MKFGKTRKIKVRRLRHIALLPTLVTLGNILCGFAAIVFAAGSMAEGKRGFAMDASSHFEMAAWMVILAMVFDALDGRVARMTHTASKFGAELDSLCDVVSFGIAPAFLSFVTIDACGGIIPRKARSPSADCSPPAPPSGSPASMWKPRRRGAHVLPRPLARRGRRGRLARAAARDLA